MRVPPYWLDSLPLTSILYFPFWCSFTCQYSPISEPFIEPVRGVPPVVKVPALPGNCISSKTWERPYMWRLMLELAPPWPLRGLPARVCQNRWVVA